MPSDIWFPESLYVEWLSASLILMTTSLLFYHMTRVKSLEMNNKLSGLFAVSLILISVILAGISVIPYFQRITDAVEHPTAEKTSINADKENTYKMIYTILGCCLIFIQLCIAISIIHGTFKKRKN